jgi:hypothetical protein
VSKFVVEDGAAAVMVAVSRIEVVDNEPFAF